MNGVFAHDDPGIATRYRDRVGNTARASGCFAPVATSPGLTHAERSPTGGGPGHGRFTPAGRKVLYATTHPSSSSAVHTGMFWNVPPLSLPSATATSPPIGIATSRRERSVAS